MPGWLFVDWAMTERAEVVGAIDALYAAALEDFAVLGEALGESTRAGDARRRARVLARLSKRCGTTSAVSMSMRPTTTGHADE